jgi:hypothetical protein
MTPSAAVAKSDMVGKPVISAFEAQPETTPETNTILCFGNVGLIIARTA